MVVVVQTKKASHYVINVKKMIKKQFICRWCGINYQFINETRTQNLKCSCKRKVKEIPTWEQIQFRIRILDLLKNYTNKQIAELTGWRIQYVKKSRKRKRGGFSLHFYSAKHRGNGFY